MLTTPLAHRAAALTAITALLSLAACPSLETRSPSRASSEAAPDFELPATTGETVALADLLAEDATAVIVFYRGHW